MSDNTLSHYGIKGMKWGVTRRVGSNGRVDSRPGDSHDYTVSRRRKATPNRQLSTKELKDLNERLNLEKTNKELTQAGAIRKIKAGTAAVGAIVAVGTLATTAVSVVNGPAGQLVKNMVIKSMNK